jgi:hypothetical protein
MTFLQNLWRDLVDKKLWPVAVALVLAAIAVPFLIPSGSSDVAPTPAPAGGAATPVTEGGQVTVAVAPADKQHKRPGKARNPFKPEVFAKVAKAVGAGSGGTSAGGATTSTPGGATTPGTSTPNSGTGGSGSSTTPAAPPSSSLQILEYELDVQIGRRGTLRNRKGLVPIAYLPSKAFPLLTFLGTASDGTTASFLVADGVEVTGSDRVCRPSRAACTILELKEGDTVELARVPPGGGLTKHYTVNITRIELTVQKQSAAVAKKVREMQQAAEDANLRSDGSKAGRKPGLPAVPDVDVESGTRVTR